MLEHLSVDEVKAIADLAERARQARNELVDRIYEADLGDQPKNRGDRNPTDLDSLEVLDAATGDGSYGRLRDAVRMLAPEARRELRAIMWIGRGDFAAKEWDQAVAEATDVSSDAEVAAIAEKVDLHDYLMKGLYELKLV